MEPRREEESMSMMVDFPQFSEEYQVNNIMTVTQKL